MTASQRNDDEITFETFVGDYRKVGWKNVKVVFPYNLTLDEFRQFQAWLESNVRNSFWWDWDEPKADASERSAAEGAAGEGE